MIRRLDAAVPELTTIHAACFAKPWSEGVLADLIAAPNNRIYVLEQGGRIVSFILLTVVADEAEILTLATDPAAQNQGHARRLLDRTVSILRDDGMSRLSLEVAVDNVAANKLYRAAGFARVGLRKAYYSRPDGAPVDGHILRLAFD